MRVVDEAVLARLVIPGVTVVDGFGDFRPDTNVVTIPVPYVVFTSSTGDDDEATRRLSAHIPRTSVFFSVTYVGLDRHQCKAVGEAVWALLRRWRPVIENYGCEIVQRLESQRIRRDDEATTQDGFPLFYGVDNYAVGVRRSLA